MFRIIIYFVLPIFFITSSEYSSSYYTYRILAPFLILLCSDFFDFKSFEWAKFTFLVYLSHSLVLVMLEHFPVSNFGEGLLKWCVVFLICLLLSWGAKRFFPKIYCILNGGR